MAMATDLTVTTEMSIRAAPLPLRLVEALERVEGLDGPAAVLDVPAQWVSRGSVGRGLRGEWLGHALHPLLTDLPLGCWLAASLLDLTAPRHSARAARRLVGWGLVAVPLTAASGLAELASTRGAAERRATAAHGVGNLAVAAMYLASWTARRRGRHVRGAGWALAGGLGAVATGYVGGHLSFVRGLGTGERGAS